MCEERKECYLEEWNRLAEDEIGDLPRLDLLNDNDADDNANIIRNALHGSLFVQLITTVVLTCSARSHIF